ncbi:hypothetical protein NXS98_04010 [Fontisphaera persica]|uniref:hypothetical protein n=1 Tax=Fontisphaera persica TaxID=2974023 RepID=UPI0024C0CF4A|nr:hypothetical protein [Fontisphaera persica]WCJ60305.1 hypothetical protein NXS98_04010 [Fontisphaera persica]
MAQREKRGAVRVHQDSAKQGVEMEATKIMALKFKLKSKDEVPAELVNLYVERDGAWHLDVEGAVDKAKLEEFRATNVALMKERDELKQRFEGIDPEEVRKLADEKRKLEEAQALRAATTAGEVEKLIEARVRAVRGELDKKLAGVTGERDALNARLTAIQIDQAVVTEATKRGLRASAIPDITSRARNTFRLVNGVPQALEADGQTARVGKDGLTPLSLAEWIDMQVSEAPHLFESNAGGGGGGATSPYGTGSGGAGNRFVRNPFRKESWNLTEQMRLQKSDPGLAARLKAAA